MFGCSSADRMSRSRASRASSPLRGQGPRGSLSAHRSLDQSVTTLREPDRAHATLTDAAQQPVRPDVGLEGFCVVLRCGAHHQTERSPLEILLSPSIFASQQALELSADLWLALAQGRQLRGPFDLREVNGLDEQLVQTSETLGSAHDVSLHGSCETRGNPQRNCPESEE